MVAPDDGIENDAHVICELAPNKTNIMLDLETSKPTPENLKQWPELSTSLSKNNRKQNKNDTSHIKPIILVNDKLAEDLDDKRRHLVENAVINEKFKSFPTRRKYKRRYCRSKRHAVFKRSYSIA